MSTKAKILYVEDYPVIQTMYADALKAKGFTVDSVNDGKIALAKLDGNDYDVILLDLLLPHLTGVEFLRVFIKKNSPDSVIVLTDFDKPETVKEVKDLGVKHYWIKVENTPHIVAERIAKLLEDRAAKA